VDVGILPDSRVDHRKTGLSPRVPTYACGRDLACDPAPACILSQRREDFRSRETVPKA